MEVNPSNSAVLAMMERLKRLERLVDNLPDSICRCCGESMWTTDGVDYMCVTCEETFNCEWCGEEE